MEKRIYNRLKTDMNKTHFNEKNMGANLEHFRQEAASYLSGPGEYENLSFLEVCQNLEGEGVISCKELETLKLLVETAPKGKQQMLDRIVKAEEDIQKCQSGIDVVPTRTTVQPELDAATSGGAGNHHKTENTTVSFALYEAMVESKLRKSVGVIKIKMYGQLAGSGTGFRFGENYVMTAYHVLEEIVKQVWKLVKAKVGQNDKKEAINQEISRMFGMTSADIEPKRQALPFGKLFTYLHEMGLKIEGIGCSTCSNLISVIIYIYKII
ncbi:uncharacterized protein LOC110454901 isoform X1 [Mizuhopecten yessoensis]|uniref:uncharacterized protein LOC110454901 isoform X1 n=1 Tax=Mizuhopecten yessoensis TaxID=6573 RepID=UPI000B4598AC|nr:uncharacterized protein LOC110454901 isoform X1 [Mizuhopecten yessoensis]